MDDERRTLGRYEILGTVGRGAMGVVYKARDPLIDRVVAIKQVSLPAMFSDVQREEFTRRFFGEAKAAGRLHHPNIVTIYDLGEEGGAPFMAMELVDGESLGQVLKRRGPLPAGEALSIARQVALGLAFAHEQGVIHRDIKPDNILLDKKGRPVITDFGVAHLEASDLTRTGEILGTPHFMSPEQVKGEPLDGRSDLFSLGVVLYEMLTGQRPFRGDTISSICYQIVHAPPKPDPSELDLSPQVRLILSGLLAKNREERFPDGHSAAASIDSVLTWLDTGETRAFPGPPRTAAGTAPAPAVRATGASDSPATVTAATMPQGPGVPPVPKPRRVRPMVVVAAVLGGLFLLVLTGALLRGIQHRRASVGGPQGSRAKTLEGIKTEPAQQADKVAAKVQPAPAASGAGEHPAARESSPGGGEKKPPVAAAGTAAKPMPSTAPPAATLVPVTVDLSGPIVAGGYAIFVDGKMRRQSPIHGKTDPSDSSRKGFRARESWEEPSGTHTLRFAIRPAFSGVALVQDWTVVLKPGQPVHLWVAAHPRKTSLSVKEGEAPPAAGE